MQFLNKEAAYEKRNKLTACFAEPPLFWAAQEVRGPEADSSHVGQKTDLGGSDSRH